MTRPTVVFLGPCQKLDPSTSKPFESFSPRSRSGKFLRAVIGKAGLADRADIIFDNVLHHPVFDENGRERNPDWRELLAGLPGDRTWSRSQETVVVVALSSPVRQALEHARDRGGRKRHSTHLVAAQHPSYVMRRPIAERDRYVLSFAKILDVLPAGR